MGGGTAPSQNLIKLPGAPPPANFDFAKGIFNQYLPKLVGDPLPSYKGSIDPGLSPTMQAALTGAQNFSMSPLPGVMGQSAGLLGKFMGGGMKSKAGIGPGGGGSFDPYSFGRNLTNPRSIDPTPGSYTPYRFMGGGGQPGLPNTQGGAGAFNITDAATMSALEGGPGTSVIPNGPSGGPGSGSLPGGGPGSGPGGGSSPGGGGNPDQPPSSPGPPSPIRTTEPSFDPFAVNPLGIQTPQGGWKPGQMVQGPKNAPQPAAPPPPKIPIPPDKPGTTPTGGPGDPGGPPGGPTTYRGPGSAESGGKGPTPPGGGTSPTAANQRGMIDPATGRVVGANQGPGGSYQPPGGAKGPTPPGGPTTPPAGGGPGPGGPNRATEPGMIDSFLGGWPTAANQRGEFAGDDPPDPGNPDDPGSGINPDPNDPVPPDDPNAPTPKPPKQQYKDGYPDTVDGGYQPPKWNPSWMPFTPGGWGGDQGGGEPPGQVVIPNGGESGSGQGGQGFSGPSVMDSINAALPVLDMQRDKQIGDSIATAGFGGNRFGSAAMNSAADIGGQTALKQTNMTIDKIMNQGNIDRGYAFQGEQNDLGRMLQAASQGQSMGGQIDQQMMQRLGALNQAGQWEQNRGDQFAQQRYGDFMNSRLGLLPQILGAAGGGGPQPGAPQYQTMTTPGKQSALDMYGPYIAAIFGSLI